MSTIWMVWRPIDATFVWLHDKLSRTLQTTSPKMHSVLPEQRDLDMALLSLVFIVVNDLIVLRVIPILKKNSKQENKKKGKIE